MISHEEKKNTGNDRKTILRRDCVFIRAPYLLRVVQNRRASLKRNETRFIGFYIIFNPQCLVRMLGILSFCGGVGRTVDRVVFC